MHSHDDSVQNQFGPQAQAYLTSAVHARGPDLEYPLTIDFLEAAKGCEKEIQVPKHAVCTDCTGSGAATGSTDLI